MKYTTHIRASIIIVIIVSSFSISPISPTHANTQTDSATVSVGTSPAAAVYDPATGNIVTLLNDAILASYDPSTGNQVWSRSLALEQEFDLAYSSSTGLFYVLGSTAEGNLGSAQIRVYDSDGDYQGGNTSPWDSYALAIDQHVGTKIGARDGGNTEIEIIDTSPPFNTEYNLSVDEGEIRDLDEGSNLGVVGDDRGNDIGYVFNLQTGSIVSSFNGSYSTNFRNARDKIKINGEYIMATNGMFDAQTGDFETSVSGSRVAIHPTQNIGYIASGSSITVVSPSGTLGSIPLPLDGVNSLQTQEINGEMKIVYSTSAFSENYVGYVDANVPPGVDGYVKKSLQNTISPLAEANVTMYNSTTGNFIANTTTGNDGFYSIRQSEGNYTIVANKSGWTEKRANVTFPPSITRNFTLRNKSALFNFDVSNYMSHGEITPYSATFSGSGYRKQSITDEITVTSDNTSIVAVERSNHTLIATSNVQVNNQTQVTATYVRDGITYSETENVTVANLTIENIEVMPPSQWIPAVLGFGEPGTVFGLGSEIQWILVIIFTGSAAAWFARNEWLGIGVIVGMITLFWVLGDISLGIVFVAVSYGAFAGYQLNKIPSRSDTDVGGGNMGNQDDFNRPRDRYQE